MPDLTALDWTYIGVGWFAIACFMGVLFGRSIRRADEQPDEFVELITEPLPPVSPTRPRYSDADWLSVWPTDAQPAWDDLDEVMFRWFAEGSAR